MDKPAGCTSHDVVAMARKHWPSLKIGHGGTLDPMATGLLLLLLGSATRLFDLLQSFRKTYLAQFCLGFRTDTQDRTGQVIAYSDPGLLPLPSEQISQTLGRFRGEIFQLPPMYSALKRGGKKLVDLARRGETVNRSPRKVHLYAGKLLEFDGVRGVMELEVSSGFYVRTLIDDLGVALGVGAVLTELRRTAIGPFCLEDAHEHDATWLFFNKAPQKEKKADSQR